MKFTILSACFNKENFISECVNSILAQTYTDWEYIIVDDCSTDKSYKYLSSIRDTRIKVIRNETRKFCSSTYAVALRHATGDICGVVDGDDVLASEAVAKILKLYKEHPELDYIYTQHYWCDKNLKSKRTGLSSAPKRHLSLAEMTQAGKHCFSHWRTFKKSVSDRGVIFPEGMEVSVDKNMGFALEELGPGGFHKHPLYYYRYYPGNMSLVQGGNQKKTTKKMAKERIQKRINEDIHVYPIIWV